MTINAPIAASMPPPVPAPIPMPAPPVVYAFRLYVAGDTQNSSQALRELSDICVTYLADRHQIEVVDVFREPERALADGIFLTPMLLKLGPLPTCRIVGTLGQRSLVLRTLGLPVPAPTHASVAAAAP